MFTPRLCQILFEEFTAGEAKSILRVCLIPFAAHAITSRCSRHSGLGAIQFAGTQRDTQFVQYFN